MLCVDGFCCEENAMMFVPLSSMSNPEMADALAMRLDGLSESSNKRQKRHDGSVKVPIFAAPKSKSLPKEAQSASAPVESSP
jgi:hypothetical protein